MSLPIECDPERHEVIIHGHKADLGLSVQEFTLLDALCARYGRLCTRDELGAAMWGAGNFEYNMLHRLVNRTRMKLPAELGTPVTSVAGLGYKIEVAENPTRGDAAFVELPSPEAAPSWSQFVGRQTELGRMRHALEKTLAGGFGVAMLVGEAGVGKTRLATEFIASISVMQLNVLEGRCSEGDGGLAYRPFIEAFRRHFRSLTTEELREQTSFDPAMLTMLVADIGERLDDVSYRVDGDAEAQRLRLFEAVTQFLRKAAARTPLLLFLDDLHWADNASLLLLQYVVRAIGQAPLLIVGAYRDDEVEDVHPLGETLALLRRGENYERLSLRGLEQDDVFGMLAAMDGAQQQNAGTLGLAQEIHKQTGGNPFFIRQILDHLREEGQLYQSSGGWGRRASAGTPRFVPEGVRDVITRRISRLSHRCQKMLTRA
jgi:predicted ATPase/DNA-binding winged helix-turn-helix (wHTH) protein